MGGEVLSNPSAIPLLTSAPNPRRMRQRIFSFDNRGGGKPGEVRVRVTCMKFFPPAGKRWMGIRKPIIVRSRIQPIKVMQTVATPACPKRRVLVDRGIEVMHPRDTPKKQAAWASVRKTGVPVEVSKSWIAKTKRGERAVYRVGSSGPDGYGARVTARCLEPALLSGPIGPRGRGAPTHVMPIGVKLSYLDGPIEPGVNRVKASCPKGFLSIGTGHLFPPGHGLSLFRSFPLDGPLAIWEIDSPAASQVQVKIQLQCLSANRDWRRIR